MPKKQKKKYSKHWKNWRHRDNNNNFQSFFKSKKQPLILKKFTKFSGVIGALVYTILRKKKIKSVFE